MLAGEYDGSRETSLETTAIMQGEDDVGLDLVETAKTVNRG